MDEQRQWKEIQQDLMQYDNISMFYHHKSKMFATFHQGKWLMASPGGQWTNFDSDTFYCKFQILGVCGGTASPR
jgi:hypothetical protein